MDGTTPQYLTSLVCFDAQAPPELLPLLVSATVGGAEIFPLLLRYRT
jgi:hypothetical protein